MTYDGARLCGIEDSLAVGGAMCRWPSPDVSWCIVADLPGFARDAFRQAAEVGFAYWAAVCGLRPRFVPGPNANIVLGIQTIGRGGVLADSELPCGVSMKSSLRQRYDTAEAWTVAENPPGDKVDLVRVICHEVGHAIGIPHIGNANSGNLMAPVYSAHIRRPRSADIAEAVARYGLPAPAAKPPVAGPEDLTEVMALLSNGHAFYVRRNGVLTAI